MSRLDFDVRMLKLPSLPRGSIEGFLRYRSRSLYPGNPEETAFAWSLVRSGGARYAVLFLCKRSIADGYLKLAAGRVGADGKNPNVMPGGWGSGAPLSSHALRVGEPEGGNFLFEDGHA